MRRPVCRLKKALYGHPDSGTYWEMHCDKSLAKVGFEKVEGWECLYIHKQYKQILSIYVDDFFMAGIEETHLDT